MRIVWEELLPRLKSVEIDGDVQWSAVRFVGGPKQLPIRLTME
jgi:hypothetical protein